MANPRRKKSAKSSVWMSWMSYLHNHVTTVNQSKIFAGIIILVINIASKFVTIQLGKTMESYLKYTFSRNVLIFAMAWMGTRDIYVALFITFLFMILVNYFFNEKSRFCCMPANFMKYHEGLDTNLSTPPTQKQIADAIETLNKLKDSFPETSSGSSVNTVSSHADPAPYTPMVG
jgi:hypothetical protein